MGLKCSAVDSTASPISEQASTPKGIVGAAAVIENDERPPCAFDCPGRTIAAHGTQQTMGFTHKLFEWVDKA